MFVKGAMYAGFLAHAEHFYPTSPLVVRSYPHARTDWLLNSPYNVVATTQSGITLEAPTEDFSSVFMTDVELLLDHCYEQLVELICFEEDLRPRSVAWHIVTWYYFGFFAASALLRLIGRPVMYLDKERLIVLKQLAPPNAKIRSGTYTFERTADLSLTHSEYQLSHSPEHVHEKTWRTWIGLIRTKLAASSAANPPTDLHIFASLVPPSTLPDDWPSRFRNNSNYVPGYAYQAVHKTRPIKIQNQLRALRGHQLSDLFTSLANSSKTPQQLKQEDQFLNVALLAQASCTIFSLVIELHKDLSALRKIRCQGRGKREKFVSASLLQGAELPFG